MISSRYGVSPVLLYQICPKGESTHVPDPTEEK